jgi:hypothetical protein
MGSDQFRIIQELAARGLFRECQAKRLGAEIDWLRIAGARKYARGIWGPAHYKPTHYELFQVRYPRAVFWGPSALWLLGATSREPEGLWVAIGNKSRQPRNLESTTVIVRTRNLEQDVVTWQPPGRLNAVRVHSVERALRDVARNDTQRMNARADDRLRFELIDGATLLWSETTSQTIEEYLATRRRAHARSRSGSTPLPSPLRP